MDAPRAAATSATTRPSAPNPPVTTIVLPRIAIPSQSWRDSGSNRDVIVIAIAAKQSRAAPLPAIHGLLRRFAPRNDGSAHHAALSAGALAALNSLSALVRAFAASAAPASFTCP